MNLALSLVTSSPQGEVHIEEVQCQPHNQIVNHKQGDNYHHSGHTAYYCHVNNMMRCQLCSQLNHSARDCWSRN